MSKQFGERLSAILHEKNITQKELAARINTTEATLSRYISGEREPKACVLAEIATALDLSSDYLLGIEKYKFDFKKAQKVLTENASVITKQEKRALINALFNEN